MRKLYIRPVTGVWSSLIGLDVWEMVYKDTIEGEGNWGRIPYNPMGINFSLNLTPLP